MQIKKKLRIFISHQYPVRVDTEPTSIDDEQVQYWEMRVEGRLLDDVSSIHRPINSVDHLFVSSSQIPINTIKEKQNGNFHHSFVVLSLS